MIIGTVSSSIEALVPSKANLKLMDEFLIVKRTFKLSLKSIFTEFDKCLLTRKDYFLRNK